MIQQTYLMKCFPNFLTYDIFIFYALFVTQINTKLYCFVCLMAKKN
jgi:hypothetical protein